MSIWRHAALGRCLLISLLAVLFLLPAADVRAAPTGFGAFGDSLSDEYQFASAPRNLTRNYVELLATYRGFNFGAFTTADRGEPRNQGYAFDWGNVGELTPIGITTADLIPSGQVAGLAQQVATGQVNVAFLTVGGNDFRSIFTGANPTTVIQNGLTNELTAVGAILAANPTVQVVVANVPDITLVPGARAALLSNPALAPELAQVSAAIDLYNATLAAQLAGQFGNRVAVADINSVLKALIANPQFGPIKLDTLNPSPDANHLFVDDLHPGTIGQGLIANSFINALDNSFGYNYAPLSTAELLAAAVPLPAAIWAGLLVIPMSLWLARRNLRHAHARI